MEPFMFFKIGKACGKETSRHLCPRLFMIRTSLSFWPSLALLVCRPWASEVLKAQGELVISQLYRVATKPPKSRFTQSLFVFLQKSQSWVILLHHSKRKHLLIVPFLLRNLYSCKTTEGCLKIKQVSKEFLMQSIWINT